jgi:hypothetical protein
MGNDDHSFEGHLSNPVLSTDFRAFVKDAALQVEHNSGSCSKGTLMSRALHEYSGLVKVIMKHGSVSCLILRLFNDAYSTCSIVSSKMRKRS